MARRTARTPTKPAPQARARVTVDAILEATIRVLSRESLGAATTTRIAEVAGVSIGTLYHHFEDREAILEALQEREFERALTMMQGVLSEANVSMEPRDIVERVVRGLAMLYEVSPALHRVLTIQALDRADRVHAFDLRVIGVIRGFLEASRERLRCDDVEAAAFVVFQAVRATMLASLLERPPGLDLDTLERQLVDLVVRYLVRDPVADIAPRKRARARPA